MGARTLALRLAAALAVTTPVALTASAALAADPTPAPSASGPASPGGTQSPDLVLSGTQTLEGKVRFYVMAHNLPYGTTLASSALSVMADDEKLAATVDKVDGATADEVAAGTRGAVLVLDASSGMSCAALDAARVAATTYAEELPSDV